MKTAPDRYRFWFVKPNGSISSRRVFWTSLYAFTFGKNKILTAFSVVPHCDMLFAMAEAVKSNLFPTPSQIFARKAEAASEAESTQNGTGLMRIVADLMPLKTTDLANLIGPDEIAIRRQS